MVLINPADVVSVPDDHSAQKLRCSAYLVLKDVTGEVIGDIARSPLFDGDDDVDTTCPYCEEDPCVCDVCPDCGEDPCACGGEGATVEGESVIGLPNGGLLKVPAGTDIKVTRSDDGKLSIEFND